MSKEDVQVGRLSAPGMKFANVDTASTPLVPHTNKRKALIISAPPTNRVTISWGGAAVLDRGITLMPGTAPLTLTIETHGQIVEGPIFAISAVAAQDIGFYEAIYPEL